MSSRVTKNLRAEESAYAAYRAASAALIVRVTDGIDDAETARLRRRADAYRTQWEAAARKSEGTESTRVDRSRKAGRR